MLQNTVHVINDYDITIASCFNTCHSQMMPQQVYWSGDNCIIYDTHYYKLFVVIYSNIDLDYW